MRHRREVAALTGAPLTAPALPAVAVTLDERAVTLRADAACGRYLGRVIRGVNQARADAGLDENPGPRRPALDFRHCRCHQLHPAGTRPAAARLIWPSLQGGIVVRMARAGETLTLLNGRNRRWTPICW